MRHAPFAVVRIRQLTPDGPARDGWRVNRRAPQVGDVGVVVDVLHAPGLPDVAVVESLDADGHTVWLAEFLDEELEPARSSS